MLKKMKMKTKIVTMLMGAFVLIFLFIGILGSILLVKDNKSAVKNILKRKETMINHNINRISKKALREAAFYASLPDAKKAYLEFYKTNDFEIASQILVDKINPIIKGQEKILGSKVKIHYHLPPARSFSRMWTDKRGDDLGSFRNSVLTISKTKRPVLGIEPGRAGLVIRGLAPIFDDKGKYLGDVESIHKMAALYKVTDRDETKENFAIYMDNKLLEITTKFKFSNVEKNVSEVNKFSFVSKTKDFDTANVLPEMIDKGKVELAYFEKNNFMYVAFPIKSFDNKTLAVLLYQYDDKEMEQQLLSLIYSIGLLSLVILILLMIFSIFITNGIIRPLGGEPEDMANIVKHIASGDLTIKFDKNKKYIGLYENLRVMTGNLFDMITKMKLNSETLANSAEGMSKVSTELSTGAENMTTQSNNVAGASEELSTNINSMSSAAEEMSINAGNVASASEQLSMNMNNVAGAVKEVSISVKSVETGAEKSAQTANDAVDMSNDAGKTMSTLGVAAEDIDEVTDTIKRIAEQTNLLAVNATIEAASAGEAGKGFAVVANEIKDLAKQSAQAATDIAKKIKGIQGNSKEAIAVIDKISEIIKVIQVGAEESFKLTQEQATAINEISSNISDATTGTRDIAESISEVAKGSEEVAQNAGEAGKGANEISGNISEVNQVATDVSSGSAQINTSATELARIAEELKDMVEKFKV